MSAVEETRATPRVAMVVTNAVAGDSRVQKVAWSAAAAGWDCVLVGVDKAGRGGRGHLGGAEVVLAAPPVLPAALHQGRRVVRGVRRRALRLAAPHPATGVRRALWTGLVRDADHRRTQPELRDWVRAMVPHLVAARPDVIHAHDFTALAVALPALARLRALGAPARLVYDAHEYLPGVLGHDAVWTASMLALEAAGIAAADEVITVSDTLAAMLVERHGLRVPVTVVTNAPVAEPLPAGRPGLREVVGVPEPAPLLVYSGGVAPQRGLDSVVDALPALPGTHLALLSGRNRHVEALLRRAGEQGVADRLHVTPYVAPALVSAFVEGATAGVVPSLHVPNHEISLPTKYYEYALAGLPVVVSDIAVVARITRELGNGEVFPAGDAAACAAAAALVLAGPAPYRLPYTDALKASFTWQEQVPALLGVYERLAGRAPEAAAPSKPFSESPLEVAEPVATGAVR